MSAEDSSDKADKRKLTLTHEQPSDKSWLPICGWLIVNIKWLWHSWSLSQLTDIFSVDLTRGSGTYKQAKPSALFQNRQPPNGDPESSVRHACSSPVYKENKAPYKTIHHHHLPNGELSSRKCSKFSKFAHLLSLKFKLDWGVLIGKATWFDSPKFTL